MTSTVLDVTMMLLCVSASVITLGAIESGPDAVEYTAADAADRLVTETVTVTYAVDEQGYDNRTVHATLVELLARATGGQAAGGQTAGKQTAGGQAAATSTPTPTHTPPFRKQARLAVRDALGARTNVVVRRVKSGATRSGPPPVVTTVGPRPPPNADVSTAVVWHPAPGATAGATRLQLVVRVW